MIDALSQQEQLDYFALSVTQSELVAQSEHGAIKSALGIWMNNAYPTDSGGEIGVCSAVFALACRLNHDCRPNAHICWNDRIGMQTVHALRKIRAGDEVLVAYIGEDADGTRATRQRQLLKKFSFTCSCLQCGLTGVPLEESETRQRRINEILVQLKTRPSVGLVQERLGLMEKERMPGIWGKSSALLALTQLSSSGNGATRELAWGVASQALECCNIALGSDAHETIAFASFTANPAFAKLQKRAKKAGRARAPPSATARRDRDLNQLSAKIETAKHALADAADEEAAAVSREREARERAAAAFEASSRAGNELLILSREAHGGTIWTFAAGVFDNPQISWTDLEYATAKLADGVKEALMHDAVDGGLIRHLRAAPYASEWARKTRAGASSKVLSLREFIGSAGCSALRNAVDAESDRTRDTVDHFAQHTLTLSIDRLKSLVGPAVIERLQQLPLALLRQRKDEATVRARVEAHALRDARSQTQEAAAQSHSAAADGATLEEAMDVARDATLTASMGAASGFTVQAYIRRYSRSTRPWLGFHTDRSVATVNVALAADSTHEGGRLHAVLDGEHRIVEREEGEATVHGDDVMHAVSTMRTGVRYSLVLLFFLRQ